MCEEIKSNVTSIPRAQELLDSLMSKDDSIHDEVSKCELAANEGKFRLRDLLTVPMQASTKPNCPT